MSTKLCKWGNSLGIRLPKYVAERTGLQAGDYVFVRLLDSGEIMVRPAREKAVAEGYREAKSMPTPKEADRW